MHHYGSTLDDVAGDLDLDSEGNVIFTASMLGSWMGGEQIFESAGSYDIFVGKISSEGEELWLRSFGGTGFDGGFGIAPGPDNSILITGPISYGFSFGALKVSASERDSYILSLSDSGSVRWAIVLGAEEFDRGFNLLHGPVGTVLLAGMSGTFGVGGTAVSSAGEADLFVIALE